MEEYDEDVEPTEEYQDPNDEYAEFEYEDEQTRDYVGFNPYTPLNERDVNTSLLEQLIRGGFVPPPISTITEKLSEENRDNPGVIQEELSEFKRKKELDIKVREELRDKGVEQTSLDEPAPRVGALRGEITKDRYYSNFKQEADLIKKFFEYHDVARFNIDVYNDWLNNVLPEQIGRPRTYGKDGSWVRFDPNTVLFFPPSVGVGGSTRVDATPRRARNSHETYSLEVTATLIHEKKDKDGNIVPASDDKYQIPMVSVGKIPLMLKSEWCMLSKLTTPEEFERVGEDYNDPFGYFIIKGNEKCVLIQEMMRLNKMFLFNLTSKGNPVVRITIPTNDKTIIVQLSIGKRGGYRFSFPSLGKNSKGKNRSIGAFQLLKLMGLQNEEEMLESVCLFTKPEWKHRIKNQLIQTRAKLRLDSDAKEYITRKLIRAKREFVKKKTSQLQAMTGGVKDYEEILSSTKTSFKKSKLIKLANAIKDNQVDENNPSSIDKVIDRLINEDNFPNCNTMENPNQSKIMSNCMMICMMAEYQAGLRKLDNRDGWEAKRLESGGRMMKSLFSQLLRKSFQMVSDKISQDKGNNLFGVEWVHRLYPNTFVTSGFFDSFNTTNWGLKGISVKPNVAQTLKRANYVDLLSHLTKIDVETTRHDKQPTIRMVQNSQYGFVDSVESPEGSSCIPPNTPILLPNGSSVPIGELRNGDEVMSMVPGTGEIIATKIKDWFKADSSKSHRGLFEIVLSNGKKVQATGDHPFLTQDGFKVVDRLSRIDDMIYVIEDKIHKYVPIKSIIQIPDGPVCDFTTVADSHTMITGDGIVLHNCGILKNMAITTRLTLDQRDSRIVEFVKGRYLDSPTPDIRGKLIINGRFYGFCEVNALADDLRKLRRTKDSLPWGTSITVKGDILEIYTDASRPIRPLAIVDKEKQELMIDILGLRGASFEELVDKGAVEYLDPSEQEWIKLASSVASIRMREDSIKESAEYCERLEADIEVAKNNGVSDEEMQKLLNDLNEANAARDDASRKKPYTHCELDPTAQFGIAASLIPYLNHNQAPRNVYEASMIKQALAYPHSNHLGRMRDGKVKVLAFPTQPFFQTIFEKEYGLDKAPIGDTLVVMFGTYLGYNQEDAFILNKTSIELGKFRNIKYFTKTITVESKDSIIEELGIPKLKEGEDPLRYAHLTRQGLPMIGSSLKQGDCVIGKIQHNRDTGEDANLSEFMMVGEEGTVDSVYVSSIDGSSINNTGQPRKTDITVTVKLRVFRIPTIGDKFAPRNAQKGTIGLIVPEEDLPFSELAGRKPDIIVNPHCLPSRMTLSYIMELIGTKGAAFKGDYVDATAFRPFDLDEFRMTLRDRGYDDLGYETMYSGMSGRRIQGQIYMGPCYWQELKHHVRDKIQMRSRGSYNTKTHQPPGGRARGGGIRSTKPRPVQLREKYASHRHKWRHNQIQGSPVNTLLPSHTRNSMSGLAERNPRVR